MNKAKLTLLLIILIGLNTIDAFSQSTKANEKVIDFLKNYRTEFSASMINKKPEALANYYADGIRIMPEFQPTIIGKDDTLTYYKAFLARFDINTLTRTEIDILDLGTRIIESGLFKMKLKLKSTNKSYDLEGKYQLIWQKLSNNNLSLITEVWNHNFRTEVDDQFRFVEVPAIQTAMHSHLPVNNNITFELAALNKLMEESVSQHDPKVWSQYYTEDAILLSNLGHIQEGRSAIDKYIEAHVHEMPVFEKLDIRNDKIDHLGTYIIEYASHVANWRHGEASGVGTGKDVRIWRREADGSLKIFRQIGSYD